MTITIVTPKPGNRRRGWLHNGTRWTRPHEINLTETREPIEITRNPQAAFKRHITARPTFILTWRYYDHRSNGRVDSIGPVELRTRHSCDIWTVPT